MAGYAPYNGWQGQGYSQRPMQQPMQQPYFNGAAQDMLGAYKNPYMPGAQQMQPQMVQQPQMMQQPPMQQMGGSDMTWVLDEVEARSFPVASGNTVTLWDKNMDTLYIKSVSAQGVPSLRILDFTERTQEGKKSPVAHECKCGDKYATKQAVEQLAQEFYALRDKLNGAANVEREGGENG